MFLSLGEFWKRSESKRLGSARNTRPYVESLEKREMLTAVTMTDYEQLLLEMVNRARMDPLGEVARNPAVNDLNQDLPAGTISSTPKQPLASVQELVDAGQVHALDMLARDYFDHITLGTTDVDPEVRAAAEGYSGSVGENIAWNGIAGSSVPIDKTAETIFAHNELFKSFSHRENLMWDDYEESGLAVEFGDFTSNGNTFDAAMVAEEFGYNSGNPYLTGVAFSDDVIADDFYSVGESESGILVTADDGSGGIFTTLTGVSGGYNMKLPSGTYTVTASGGSLTGDMIVNGVVVGEHNVKVDFNSSEAPTGPVIEQDLLGFNSGDEFWVGTSNGSTLGTAFWGELDSTTSYSNVGVGDFNGDGFDDVATRAATGELIVGISTANATGRTFVSAAWGDLTTITGWTDILVGDFNGDGLDDLLGRADSDGTFWLAESNGTSFTNSYWGKLINSVQWSDLSVGDFNGDGRDDTVARAPDGTWWASVSDGTRLNNSYWGRWSTGVSWSDVSVGDFNGDGLDDLAGRANNRYWWVNRSSASFFFVEYWGSWTNSVQWVDVTVADFDGDGNDDIGGRANGQWWLAMSNGQNFQNEFWGYWTTATTWSNVNEIDVDGDGKDDIIGRAGNGQWWAFISDGSRFNGTLVTTWAPGATWQFVGVGNFA